MPIRADLTTAANGFGWITDLSLVDYLWLGFVLSWRYGFARRGETITLPDEAIFRSFVKGDVEILAGRDLWTGYSLLASNGASDTFLRAFFRQHCRTHSRRPGVGDGR